MTKDSGGGGSGSNKRNNTPPTEAPVYHPSWSAPPYKPGSGYSRTDEVKAAQRDNRRKFGEEAYDPEGKKARVEAQVEKADAAARRNREQSVRLTPASAETETGEADDDISDGIADAIIGAVFLIHKVRQVGSKVTHPGVKDLTPKTDAVFRADPNVRPPRVKTREDMQRSRERYYSGSADNMERQAERVRDQTETVPGEFD